MVVAGSMKKLRTIDFGPPLHCLTIVGKTHPVEEEMLNFYRTRYKTLDFAAECPIIRNV
nr:probable diphthine methyl ester synthase [Tanacetum cinerariifolium]